MEKEFVSYKQAVALKELGFDKPCLRYYFKHSFDTYALLLDAINGDTNSNTNSKLNRIHKDYITAPLKQQVFRWFREKYDLVALIDIGVHELSFKIFKNTKSITPLKDYLDFNGTYEEAENACIEKLLELAKQQDK